MKWGMASSLLIILSLLTGCGEQIIDELGLLDVIAYDDSGNEDEPLTVTINYPTITEDGEFEHKTLSVNAKSSKDSRRRLQKSTNLQLVSGQVSVALFGEELAEKGLNDIFDTFMRDPSIGSRVMLGVTAGQAKGLLLHEQKGVSSAVYIRTFLENLRQKKESVNYNIYQFVRDMKDEGVDPIAPFFSIEGKEITLDGYALFNDSRYVGKLSNDESMYLFFLRKDIPKGTFTMDIPHSEQEGEKRVLMFNYYRQHQKLDIKMSGSQPVKADIYIDIEGSVLEYTGEEPLDEVHNQEKLERKVNAYLTEKSAELLKFLQETGVDPLGIGSHVRSKMTYEEWKELDWNTVYPAMDITVHSNMKFMDIGQVK